VLPKEKTGATQNTNHPRSGGAERRGIRTLKGRLRIAEGALRALAATRFIGGAPACFFCLGFHFFAAIFARFFAFITR
jgi:hypothetical protein